MEFNLVPQIIIVTSMGIIIFILGKNISKVRELPDDSLFENKGKKEKENFLYLYKRLTRRINKEKYQEKVNSFWVWFEKILRKLRIRFLRLDNKIVSTLDKVKEKNIESESEEQKNSAIITPDTSSEKEDLTENKNKKEKEYINLISKNPLDIKSYWKLGIVYSRKKNYKDAISCFRQITKIDPSYTKAKKKIIDLMGRMRKK